MLSFLLFVALSTFSQDQTKTTEKAKTVTAVKTTTGPIKVNGTLDIRYAENKAKSAALTTPKKKILTLL